MSDVIDVAVKCDVLVIGAGSAGYCAAIAAGREGADTVLLELDSVLGGNSSPNLGVGITGADRYHSYAAETGIIHAIQEEAAWIGAFSPFRSGAYTISRRHEAVVQEHLERAGVRVLKRHYARRPVMDGHRIVAVIVEDLAAFQTVRIGVTTAVIEASGDGEVASLAGADFDVGSESRAEFGERSAPEARSRHVQGSSLVAIAWRTGHRVTFHPPAGTPALAPRIWHGALRGFLHHHENFFGGRDDLTFLYVTEAGGDCDTIRDDGEIYETLLKQLWAEWDHIKNGPHAQEASEWDLLWVSPKAGKRESRRLLGDYVLTQTDLESARTFDDDIAYGGHDLDDHRPLPDGASDIHGFSVPPLYGIPFRCCYSRNVDNLLMAGRLMSATHLAHASTRVMRTGCAVGEAVGLAAAMCREYGEAPRELASARLPELRQRLLRHDVSLPGVALDGAGDLARSSRVSASSEWRFNDQEPGTSVPLLKPLGNVLWDWPETLEGVEVHVANRSGEDQPLTLSVAFARPEAAWLSVRDYHGHGWNDLSADAFETLAQAAGVAPAGATGWVRLALDAPLSLPSKAAMREDERLLVSLGANPNLSWAAAARACETAAAVEFFEQPRRWGALDAMLCMRLSPTPRLGEADSVVNGYSRRFGIAPLNMWVSDPGQPLPQDLTLAWDAPQEIRRISVTFDNLACTMHGNPWEYGPRVKPQCVRSYVLEAQFEDGRWHELASRADNYHRHCVHEVEPVRAASIRLRVLAAHGEEQPARVFQLRVE